MRWRLVLMLVVYLRIPFKVETGIKQGDSLATDTVFCLLLHCAQWGFPETCNQGIYIRYRSSGKLLTYDASLPKPKFYQRLFVTSSTQMTVTWSHIQNPICSVLWIDYRKQCRGVRPHDQFRQDRSDVPACPRYSVRWAFHIYRRKKLKVVDKFTYLGSTINRFCSLDDEIALRLKKATGAFSALKHRVWSQRGLKKSTTARSVQYLCTDMPSILMWNVGGVSKTSKTAWAFSSAMPKIYSRYPLDNPHSRHRSLGESECNQHRGTHPTTSSSLGGPRYNGLMTTRIPKQLFVWRTICWLPAHSISRRNASKTVSRTH